MKFRQTLNFEKYQVVHLLAFGCFLSVFYNPQLVPKKLTKQIVN
jgi:hypothetical protein